MKKKVIAVICILGILIGFKVTHYQSSTIFGYDGLVITNEQITDNLSNAPKKGTGTLVKANNVTANELIYKQSGNLYYGDKKKTKLAKGFPTFINGSKGLLTLDGSATLIDHNFDEHKTFPNLVLTGGNLYQGVVNDQLDQNQYYFMKLENGFFINSLDMKVKTKLHDYVFPLDSIHNFTEKSIQSYIPVKDGFKYNVIPDVDMDSTITIGTTSFKYKDLLMNLNLIAKPTPPDTAKKDEPKKEEVKKAPAVDVKTPIKNNNNGNDANKGNEDKQQDANNNFAKNPPKPYIKPKVIVSEFLGKPYGFTSKLTIVDPDRHIKSAITFRIYDGDTLILRKSYYSSSDLDFNGLKPNTNYRIVGDYEYINEQGKQVSDTFLDVVAKSGSAASLPVINMSGKVDKVLYNGFTLDDFKITSDLNIPTLAFVQKISIKAGSSSYDLKTDEIAKFKQGQTLSIDYPGLLESNNDYKVSIHLYDVYRNELPSSFQEQTIHTPKKLPAIIYTFDTKNIDYFKIKYKITDSDHVNPTNGVFQLMKLNEDGSLGSVVAETKQSDVKDNTLEFKDFAYSDSYMLRYAGTVDVADGKGIKDNVTINDFKIINVPLSQLGALYLTTNVPSYTEADSYTKLNGTYNDQQDSYPYTVGKDTSYTASYDYNDNLSSSKLLELLDSVKVNLYTKDENNKKTIIQSDTYKTGDQVFDGIKDKKTFSLTFNNLTPDTKYYIEFVGYFTNKTIGVSISIDNFHTWKQTPTANLKNLVVSKDSLYASVNIMDPASVSESKKGMVVLQEFDSTGKTDTDKLTGGTAIDLSVFDLNSEFKNVNLKGLTPGKKYVLNFYIGDANWGNDSIAITDGKIYLQSYVFTATDSVSGKIDVTNITANTADSTKLDVSLKTTFMDKENIGTGTYFVDIYKGNSDTPDPKLSYSNAYTKGQNIEDTKVLTLPKENVTYRVRLYIVSNVFGNQLSLSETTFNTQSDIKLINTCDELYAIDGSSSRYKVTQDLDCTKNLKPINTFSGELDFDGHMLTYQYVNTLSLFNRLEKTGVIKNLNLNIVEATRTKKGFVNQNYGTITNLYLQSVGASNHPGGGFFSPSWGSSEIAYDNYGTIDNFVLVYPKFVQKDATENLAYSTLGETNMSLGVVNNNGIVKDGYVSNGKLSVEAGGYSNTTRVGGGVVANNNSNGVVENVFSLANLRGSQLHGGGVNYSTSPAVANIVGNNQGTVNNVYSTQIPDHISSWTGAEYPTVDTKTGLAVGVDNGKTDDAYYIDNHLRDNQSNSRITYAQLNSVGFQNRVLNSSGSDSKFDVERFVYNGYYPQLKFDNENMPTQPLRAIPKVPDDQQIAYIDSTVKQEPDDPSKNDYYGIVTLLIRNPNKVKFTDVTFDNLDAEVIGQTEDVKNHESRVDVKLRVPNNGKYIDDHQLLSMSYNDDLANKHTINYPVTDARYIVKVSFYNNISSIDDWQRINSLPDENFKVTSDIDFSHIPNAAEIRNANLTGKVDGGGHSLSNIDITDNSGYVMANLAANGEVSNLNFDNVNINSSATQVGIFKTIAIGATVDNVHASNLAFAGSTSVGGLVGSLGGIISNSSVTDSTLRMNTTNGLNLGGIAGEIAGGYGQIMNSFVQNTNLNVPSPIVVRRIGGIVGHGTDGAITNAYADVTINAPNSSQVAGIVGFLDGAQSNWKTVLSNVYAKANITANSSVGGIIGDFSQHGTVVGQNSYTNDTVNGFFTGNIKASGTPNGYLCATAKYPNEAPKQLYVNNSTLMNDVASSDPATTIDDSAFSLAKTYTDTIGLNDNFKMNMDTNKAILPKLVYSNDKTKLLPFQTDTEANTRDIYLKSVDIKRDSDAKFAQTGVMTMQIYNKYNYPITQVNFETQKDATTNIDIPMMEALTGATSTWDKDTGITTYVAPVRPNYFVDTYKLISVGYTKDNQDAVISTNTSINCKFYRKISSFQDWPRNMNRSKYVENYYFSNDIDFGNVPMTDEQITTYFNNNVEDVDGNGHTIKNLNIGNNKKPNQVYLVKSVSGSFSNLTVDNVNMGFDFTNVTNPSYTDQINVGLIGVNNGTFDNVQFKNIHINYKNVSNNLTNSQLGIIGVNNGAIKNVSVDSSSVDAGNATNKLSNIGLLVGNANASSTYNNISITNSKIGAAKGAPAINSINVGLLAGRLQISSTVSNITMNNNEVLAGSSANVGGLAGLIPLEGINFQNITGDTNTVVGQTYTGGLFGVGRSYSVDNAKMSNLTVKSTIAGTGTQYSYVGGITGSDNNSNNNNPVSITNSSFNTMNITGQSYSGGLTGQSQHPITVKDTTLNAVTINGQSFIGGLIGLATKQVTATNVNATNTNITGYDVIGGFYGELDTNATVNNSYLDGITLKANQATGFSNTAVGGIAGSLVGAITVNLTSVGVKATSISGNQNVGGMIGIVATPNGRVNITKGYVVGTTTAQRAPISANSNAAGMVATVKNNAFATIKDSYANADVTANGGDGAAIAIARATSNVVMQRFISMGSATSKTGGAGGLFASVVRKDQQGAGANALISVQDTLILADTTMPSGLQGNADPISGANVSQGSYNNVNIYLGDKINGRYLNQDPNDHYTERYQDGANKRYDTVTGIHLIGYTNLTDPTFYHDNLAIDNGGNNWSYTSVAQNIAPQLNNVMNQFDITMTTNPSIEPIVTFKPTTRSLLNVNKDVSLPTANYYTSDVDKINIEFANPNKDTSFAIRQDGKELLKHEIDKPVYTLQYNFKSPFEIVVSNGKDEKVYKVDPANIARTAYVGPTGYSYITSDGIVSGTKQVKGTFLNMYKGKAISNTGDIYNAITLAKEGTCTDNFKLLDTATPLFTFQMDGSPIETFSSFTELSNHVERPGGIYVKNGAVQYVDASLPAYKDSIVIDDINGKHIETVLTKDGKLLDLADKLPLPDGFKNSDIAYVTDNLNNDSGIIIVVYKDGAKLVYNYKTKTIVQNEHASIAKTSFMDYLKNNLSLSNFIQTPSLSDKYDAASSTANKLMSDPSFDDVLQSATNSTINNPGNGSAQSKAKENVTPKEIENTTKEVPSNEAKKTDQEQPSKSDEQTSDKADLTQKADDSKQSSANKDSQLVAVYVPKNNDYVLYNSQDLVNPKKDKVKSVQDLAVHDAAMKKILSGKETHTKTGLTKNFAILVLVGVLIGGCLVYIIRQRKAYKEK